jgi:hypothetical protein
METSDLQEHDKIMGKIIATNPFSQIDEMFKDYVRPAGYNQPFDYLVAVCGRVDSPGPRDKRWDYIRDAGMVLIEKVLKRQPIGAGPHYFVFPDRWLVPGEAMEFESALQENPDAKKFKRIYIVTHQPYLVSGCLREQCRIVRNA